MATTQWDLDRQARKSNLEVLQTSISQSLDERYGSFTHGIPVLQIKVIEK